MLANVNLKSSRVGTKLLLVHCSPSARECNTTIFNKDFMIALFAACVACAHSCLDSVSRFTTQANRIKLDRYFWCVVAIFEICAELEQLNTA